MIKVKYRYKTKRVMDTWLRVLTDWNAGMSPKQIEERYGKKKGWTYYVLRRLRQIEA